MARGVRGAAAFERHYDDLFGPRWPGLRDALLRERHRVAYPPDGASPYLLDRASVAVAHLLPLPESLPGRQENTAIADLCAAPGGKALVLAHRLLAAGRMEETALTVNELSQNRRHRLRRVLEEHLPKDIGDRITVTGHDATRWGIHNPQRYDAILLDVPCSSERHVLETPSALAQWSPARITQLARRQYALCAAAVDSVKPGGHMLYATCALSPQENEAVLQRILQRGTTHGGTVVAVPVAVDTFAPWDIPKVEERSVGVHILPDEALGAGPMYCALLQVLPLPAGG